MKDTYIRVAFVLLHLVVGLCVAGGANASEAVQIGVSLGLTGKYKAPAEMQQRGYELWENEVNQKGGILGRPVKVIVIDDQSNSENAKQIYKSLIAQRGVDLLFGPYSSQIAAAVAPIIEDHGYPTLLPGAAADRTHCRFC